MYDLHVLNILYNFCVKDLIVISGRLRFMYDRRWYDSDANTQRALEILHDMDETQRRALSKDLTAVVKQIKEMHNEEENEEQEVSLGIERVLGLYKISNSRRWYDKVSLLSYAMKTMSTLPKEDFYNIMEGITTSLESDVA